MSTHHRDSRQKLDFERDIVVSKKRNSDSPINASMTYDLSKHPDLGATTIPKRDTVTQQAEESSKSSSPFASYDYEPASRTPSNSRPLSLLFKPMNEDELCKQSTHNLTHLALATEQENASLVQLRQELEAHFQSLKREFEVKRGKSWTPLRAWANEEWKWDDEGGAEVEEVFEWY